MRESLERFIRWVMRDTLYLGKYGSTVQRQHEDDSLDLLPDDDRVRGTGLSRVPIRHGLPGVRVRVTPGARVLLGFEAGDPRRPFVADWGPSSIEAILFDDGNAPIARVGDAVQCFWPPAVSVTGSVVIGVIPCAFTGTLTITSPGTGIIQSGAPRVRA